MVKRVVLIVMAVLALVVLGVLLTPIVIGHQIEKKYPQMLARLFPNKGLKFTVLSYHRGWYMDHATIKVDWQETGMTFNGKQSAVIKQKLHIGPIVRQANGGYVFQLARVESTTAIGDSILKNEAMLDFHHHVLSDATVNKGAVDYKLNTVTFGPISWAHEALPNKRKDHVTLSDVSVVKKTESGTSPVLQATGLRVALSNKGNPADGESNTAIHFQQLQVFSRKQPPYVLKDGLFQQTVWRDPADSRVHHRWSVKSLSVGKEPPRTIDLDYTINGLNGKAFNRLITDMKTTDHSLRMQQWAMMRDVFALLQHGLSVTVNKLFFTTANGPVTVTGIVQLPAPPPGKTPLHFRERLKATFHGTAPRLWLVSMLVSRNPTATEVAVNTKIDAWIKSGLMQASGKQLRFNAVYKQGELYWSTPDYGRLVKFAAQPT